MIPMSINDGINNVTINRPTYGNNKHLSTFMVYWLVLYGALLAYVK